MGMPFFNSASSGEEYQKAVAAYKRRQQQREYYCIVTKDGIRIFVGPHWETCPSDNFPMIFSTYGEANEYRKINLAHNEESWVTSYNKRKHLGCNNCEHFKGDDCVVGVCR